MRSNAETSIVNIKTTLGNVTSFINKRNGILRGTRRKARPFECSYVIFLVRYLLIECEDHAVNVSERAEMNDKVWPMRVISSTLFCNCISATAIFAWRTKSDLNNVRAHYDNTPMQYEPRCEKTGLWGFRPGPTQTGLYRHRICLDA